MTSGVSARPSRPPAPRRTISFLAVDDFERQIRPHPHDDHVQRVGADVDGSNAHHSGSGRNNYRRRGLGYNHRSTVILLSCPVPPDLTTCFAHASSDLRGCYMALKKAMSGRCTARGSRRGVSARCFLYSSSTRSSHRSSAVGCEKSRSGLGTVREFDVLLGVIDELNATGRYPNAALVRVAAGIGDDRSHVRERLLAKVPIHELRRVAARLEKTARAVEQDAAPFGPGTARRSWRWAIDARVARRASTLAAAVSDAGARLSRRAPSTLCA